jgi:glycyl-tRNA synthetase beta chain
MVGEFSELQGAMGGLYAREQGEPEEVWKAVYSHYRPLGLGDEEDFPLNAEGALVSLADKLDSLAAMFSAGVVPTGSRDPFGLRRAALGAVRVLLESGERLDLSLAMPTGLLLDEAMGGVNRQQGKEAEAKAVAALHEFMTERLRFVFSRRFRYDEINAVFALGALDVAPAELARRLEALAALRGSEDFEALSIAFKRVRNILAGQEPGTVDPERFREEEERLLWSAFGDIEPEASALFDKGLYGEALRALSRLRPQIDTFFDKVLVMAPEQELRENRLALLRSLDLQFTRIADISEIVAGPEAGPS